MKKLLFIIVLFTLILSCRKDKPVEASFTEIQLPTEFSLNDVHIIGDSTIWVAAGNRFGRGAVYYSPNMGQNWYLMLDNDFEIRSLKFINGRIYAVSIGNTLYWSDNSGQSWSNMTMPGWDFFNAVDLYADNNGILVGGENFGKGILNTINSASGFIKADTFQHELTDILILNDSNTVAIGYGVILHSSDKGQNWLPDKARGDFFKSVSFPDHSNGYVVGDYGSIYKSSDSGKSWKKLKSSSTFFNTKNRFTSVYFSTADQGVIAGRKGLLWISNDAAENWTPIKNLPEYDIYAVCMHNSIILAVAESGKLFIVQKP